MNLELRTPEFGTAFGPALAGSHGSGFQAGGGA
jgi:hypothetical protein